MLSLVARLGLDLLGDLVSPLRCAACEERVKSRVLFCGGCAVSVSRAGPQPARQHAVLEYGGAVATAITRFKYAGCVDLAPRLGAVMAWAAKEIAGVDVVVPVPLHPARLAERGFDQAALLARPVARRLGVKLEVRALERVRATPKQASLDRAARAANVAAAFRCRPQKRARIDGMRVLLVDDVRTTGATLSACAVALRAAGARDVASFVLACRDREG